MTTGPISPDDVRSLLGAYALDAVDADERIAVEELVAADPGAARELAELSAVAATLGAAVAGDPPAALRSSVLAAIAGIAQVDPLAGPRHAAPSSVPTTADVADPTPRAPAQPSANVTDLASRRRPSRSRWLAIAAAVVVGAAIPSAVAVQQAQRADQAHQQQQALADLLTDPSATVVHGTLTGGGVATAVLTDSQALFSASGLPDPGADHVYQLWVVNPDVTTSAGILADDAGTARQLADEFSSGDALAVTLEPAGGSTQPTTTPLVVLSAT